MRVPNHGFMDHLIVQYFYDGLNDESKQMVDACAGGTLNMLTYKEAMSLFAERPSTMNNTIHQVRLNQRKV
jgi:hypothetical protein